jgi:hypothetical protein
MGAGDPFFRIFRPDAFCVVSILIRVDGGGKQRSKEQILFNRAP